MRRNLDRRIEAVTPIEDLTLKSQIYSLLQTYINDDYFSWIMKNDGSYEKYTFKSAINRSQIDLIETWQKY
jgi:polyphosphate kinase